MLTSQKPLELLSFLNSLGGKKKKPGSINIKNSMLKLKHFDFKKKKINQQLTDSITCGKTPNKPRSEKEVNYVQVQN